MDLAAVIALLRAGDWQGAHAIVQADESAQGSCWAHGIVHLLEGDLGNARYWYGRAGRAWPSAPDPGAEIEALARTVAVARDDGGSA
jgi:hypothetical protein